MALAEVKNKRHNVALDNRETTRLVRAVSFINLESGEILTDKSTFIYDAVIAAIEVVEKRMIESKKYEAAKGKKDVPVYGKGHF